MRRQALALSQTKNELRHFYRIADLVAPVRCQRLDHRAHGWFIVRKQDRRFLVRANAPICPHSAGSRAHTLTPKGATSCARDSVNPPTAHLAAWYPVLPGRARRPPTEEI